jgi:hypothetical protein
VAVLSISKIARGPGAPCSFNILLKIIGLILFLSLGLWAHDPKLSTARFEVNPGFIRVVWTTPVASLIELQGLDVPTWMAPETQRGFLPVLLRHLVLSNEGSQCPVTLENIETVPDIGGLRYTLRFTSAKPFDHLVLRHDIFLDLPDVFENQNFATFKLNENHGRFVFTPEKRHLALTVGNLLGPVVKGTPNR